MLFTAIRLPPAESVYSAQIDHSTNVGSQSRSGDVALFSKGYSLRPKPHLVRENPIILWGLTLGITADFLELIAPLGLSKLWDMPTLSSWDIRFYTWVLTRWKILVLTPKRFPGKPLNEVGRVSGTDSKTFATSFPDSGKQYSQSIHGALPESHYETLWQAAITALFLRSGFGILLLSLLIRRLRRSH